jgi:hypothetical protein
MNYKILILKEFTKISKPYFDNLKKDKKFNDELVLHYTDEGQDEYNPSITDTGFNFVNYGMTDTKRNMMASAGNDFYGKDITFDQSINGIYDLDVLYDIYVDLSNKLFNKIAEEIEQNLKLKKKSSKIISSMVSTLKMKSSIWRGISDADIRKLAKLGKDGKCPYGNSMKEKWDSNFDYISLIK